MDKIKIVLCKTGEEAKVVEIENTLEKKQELVGGYIQALYPWREEVAFICNEEGKLCGLPLNRFVDYEDSNYKDVIAGDFLIVGAPCDSEDFTSLTEEQIKKAMELFKDPQTIVPTIGEDGRPALAVIR